LVNLLLNAARASRPGGRTGLALDIDGLDVRVVVRDSAVGISLGDLERVFDPFFSTKMEGTGRAAFPVRK
jgi:signal transduction histidine kinase